MEKNKLPIVSSEVATLWTKYIFDTMNRCFMTYALEHMEDEDIRQLYETALKVSERHIEEVTDLLKEENYPIPKGFTDEDVNVKAPRLFEDPFYAHYLYIMVLQGLTGYGISVGTSVRADIRRFFIECNTDTMMLFEKVMDMLLTKGLFNRPPTVTPPKKVDFVKEQSFMTGWFGERRPLTVIEIGDMTFNMMKMHLHVALKVGFAQVCKDEKVRKYINRGMKISNKHIKEFEDIFREEKLNSPKSWQSLVTDSTESPFSDKMIMYQIQLSSQVAIAFYGSAFSVNGRRDLAAKYALLTGELAKFAEDGLNIMINNGWYEQPPLAVDRRHLAHGRKV